MKIENELIAEFMGYHCINPLSGLWVRPGMSASRRLCFDSSWNELMPVVEKIGDVEIVGHRMVRAPADVIIYYRACKIVYEPDEDSGDEHGEFQTQTKGKTKIDATYKAVVEFIKWHNSQNKGRPPLEPA